ncbi:MAG: hypothetical protein U0796_20875 [Gemmatales bacterium]
MKYALRIVCLASLLGCEKAPAPTVAYIPPPTVASVPSTLVIVSGNGQLGAGDFGEPRQCTFVLRHQLAAPVRLQVMEKSCTCAGVKLITQPVPPGQDTEVTLIWIPKVEALETSQVRLWADVADESGKHRVRLEATGTLEPRVQVVFPRGPLDWGKFSLEELSHSSLQRVVEIYSRKDAVDQPVIAFTQPGMELVSIDALAADRLASLGAKGGYRVTVRPTIQLPHGSFAFDMHVKLAGKKLPIVLPLSGQLETSAISTNVEKITLPPRLSLQAGYKVPVVIVASRFGELKQCEIVQLSPPIFDAKVSKTNEKTWRLELQLIQDEARLRKLTTPEVWNQLCEHGVEAGSVTLKLDHPQIKFLTVPMSGSQLIR